MLQKLKIDLHLAEYWTTSKVTALPTLPPLYSQALAEALKFNPSFKHALESDEDEPVSNLRVKLTEPVSPQARQIRDNNEQGMALIYRALEFKPQKSWIMADFFTWKLYAVCVLVPLVRN